jgi:hypothetical protein
MRTVKQLSAVEGCYTDAAGVAQSVTIHYEYHYCPDDVGKAAKLFAAHYTNSAGAVIPAANATNTVAGACLITKEADKFIKCDPVTGDTKVVVVRYDSSFAPTSTAYNLDGSPYTGAIAALIECPDVELESDYREFCDSGVSFFRWFVKQDGVPTGQYFDTTPTGAAYAASGAETVGACITSTKLNTYTERNTGVLTFPDILAMSGGTRLLSVTMKQMQGIGVIKGDSGNPIPVDAGESWTWASVDDANSDNLADSVTTLDAQGGEQRIIAIYTI